MARKKGQIGLATAERSKPGKESFDYRSASVERWIAELPRGNTGETSRLVFEALREVNRLELAWKDRMRFLEHLREPVNYVQQALVRRYSGMALPLPEKTRRIVMLARTLYDEMAIGYKTAIEEMLGGSILTRDNKALTILIHRAVRYLSKSMLTCYQTYTPLPDNCWFELNALYLHAEHKGIHQAPVHDEYNTLMPESSIARAYKQILLLALSSPYRLRQGEAEAIYAALARWAGHAHVTPYDAPSAAQALFVVHMDSDQAPDYLAFDNRACSDELCRLVDTRQLTTVLIDELQRQEQGDTSCPLNAKLLSLLIRTWGVAPKRTFSRNESDASIEVVVGITVLHRILSRELGAPQLSSSQTSSYESREVLDVNKENARDVWNIFSSETMRQNYEHYQSLIEEQEAHEETMPTLTVEAWKVRNESAGGYRLAMDPGNQSKVQVGNLIGLHSRSEKRHWEVGAIRWLRECSDNEVELGVQVLAPQARPLMASHKRTRANPASYQYALLLPEVPAIKQPASLITPVMVFSSGDELTLQLPGEELDIRLGRQLQDTGNFVQFLFETADSRRKAPAKTEAESSDGGEDIWEVL